MRTVTATSIPFVGKIMSKRNQCGRRQRKAFVRQQLQFWTEEGEPKDKEAIQQHLVVCKAILKQKQDLLVASYRTELLKRSKSLGAKGCWSFLYERLPEAKQWQVDGQLRSLVAHYATQFAAAGKANLP